MIINRRMLLALLPALWLGCPVSASGAEKELPVPDPDDLESFKNVSAEKVKVSFTLSREDFEKILKEGKPVDPKLYRKTEKQVIGKILNLPPKVEVTDFGDKFVCRGTVTGPKETIYAWHLTTPNTLTLKHAKTNRIAYLTFSFDVGPGRKMKSILKGG